MEEGDTQNLRFRSHKHLRAQKRAAFTPPAPLSTMLVEERWLWLEKFGDRVLTFLKKRKRFTLKTDEETFYVYGMRRLRVR
jgi:hypothetical protein